MYCAPPNLKTWLRACNTVKNFRANSVFRASAICSKILKEKKYFNTVKTFRASCVFQGKRKLFKILNDKKSVTCRQGRQGRKCLPYHNNEICKTILGFKISNWINICPFMLKRCNFCMILTNFIANTSEFEYFFFKLGESHEGRQRLLVPPLTGWLSHWAVCHKLCWWALAVQLLLCQLCNLHVSYSAMFVYTFNMCRLLLLLYALAFHSLGLHVLYNILHMQRYAFSAAGQTCSFSDKSAKGSRQYLCLKENGFIVTTYLRTSVVLIRHHWRDGQARWRTLLWRCVDYSGILWHEISTQKLQQTWKVTFKTKLLQKLLKAQG